MARASAARIRVIGRVMSVSLWAVRVARPGGWGEAAGFYGSPPFLVQAAAAARGTKIRSLPPEGSDMSQAPTRIEHDLLGDRAVPADAYYGIHTLRALENFRITGTAISIYPELVRALACVKQAAAHREQWPRTAPGRQGRCDRASLRGDPRRQAPRPVRRGTSSRAGQGPRPT